MLVKDLMTADPTSVYPTISVAEASEIMRHQKIRHLPVVDTSGTLIGLVTRSSLFKALPGTGTGLTRFEFDYLTSSTTVGEIMIQDPLTTREDTPVEEAARVSTSVVAQFKPEVGLALTAIEKLQDRERGEFPPISRRRPPPGRVSSSKKDDKGESKFNLIKNRVIKSVRKVPRKAKDKEDGLFSKKKDIRDERSDKQ